MTPQQLIKTKELFDFCVKCPDGSVHIVDHLAGTDESYDIVIRKLSSVEEIWNPSLIMAS